MWPNPSLVCEAKRTTTLELGEEKGLLQGWARRTGSSCAKVPDSLMAFREGFLKATFGVRMTGSMTFEIGWWWGNRVVVQESQSASGSNQSGVHILVLSLTATWVGVFIWSPVTSAYSGLGSQAEIETRSRLWEHQIVATRPVVSDKGLGHSTCQKRISTESSEASIY